MLYKLIQWVSCRPWVNYCLALIGGSLAAIIIGYTVWRSWPEFQTFSWQLKPRPLIGASLLLIVAFILNALAWYCISKAFGSQVGFWKDLEIYGLSTIVRRLPGIIWQLVGRTYLYRQAQTTLTVPVWGSVWEFIIQISSGVLLMSLMLLLSPRLRTEFPGSMWALLLLIPIGWMLLRPKDILTLMKYIAPNITGKPNLTRQHIWTWSGLYVLSWALGGVILFFLIHALVFQPWSLLPVCIGLVATSGVLTLLLRFIPGGLGIRDISLLLLLELYIPSPIAVASVLMFSLGLLLGELLIAFLLFLVARGRIVWQETRSTT
jgi:glycosyltransferase 2 family protein